MLKVNASFFSTFLGLIVLYLSFSLVSGSFQCYTSEYYIENTTFDSNVTLANCTGSRNYCLTQKYASIGMSAYLNGIETSKIVYGYCGHIISLNLFNPSTDSLFQYFIVDVTGSWSLYACLTSLCNTPSYMLKIYNDNSTCEQGYNLKSPNLVYAINNSVSLHNNAITQCYFCVNCNFSNPGVIKKCKTNNPFQTKFLCTYINHKSPKTGISTWSGDCDSTWLFSSVKTDRLIEKVLSCTSNLCNSPASIPQLDNTFLCTNGFYNNTKTLALNGTKLNSNSSFNDTRKTSNHKIKILE